MNGDKMTQNRQEEYIISVDHAYVRFNLAKERVDSVKEYFIKMIKRQLRFQEFFALKDVSLHVRAGESWGIVGANGSGKSTLLKLVCGILRPYSGTVALRGSVAPMIELGAGFDPDLTARENIYLNGAVLGHSRPFMQEHFDEIVQFAELEAFLDVPVKNFSSGMAARLGFSIATIVRPQVLIVDEILAVGDYAFQRKCEKRMHELISGGTTLLYVSHAHQTVKEMCQKALWLKNGEVAMTGGATEVCDAYIASQNV